MVFDDMMFLIFVIDTKQEKTLEILMKEAREEQKTAAKCQSHTASKLQRFLGKIKFDIN